MSKLARASRPLYVAALAAVGIITVTVTAAAAASVAEADPRWLPWVGCWSPSGASEDAASAVSGVQRVCVTPVDGGDGVEFVSLANGEIVGRLRMEASGERRPVNREGCTGWESARWSADAERLYLRSELTCSGNITRRASGIIAVVSPSDWVDVQVVSVGDQRSVRILRYRSAADSTALSREIAATVRDRELARQTARLAAATTPTIADVVEASGEVEPSVVEAWLLQRMPRFKVDGASLRRLSDARVPATVIDLVVALGAPERHGERLAARGYTFMRIDPPRATTVSVVSAQPVPDESQTPPRAEGGIVEGREYYGYLHRHYEGCGHTNVLYLGAPLVPYGFYPPWVAGAYGFGSYGYYGTYGGYGYYPYIHDPYRPTPAKPASNRGAVRGIDLPDRRPTQPVPQPDPDPATQPAGGRVINGRGYTRPVEPDAPATSRAGTSAPVPVRSGTTKAPDAKPAETKPVETKPAPAAEPRTAKRRPPGAA